MAIYTTYSRERFKMLRARKKMQVQRCNTIKSLEELAEFLKTPEGQDAFKHDHPENDIEYKLTPSVVTDKNGFSHVILRNEELLEKLEDCEICNLDGTFGSRPNFKDCAQLLTVMVRKFNKVSKLFLIYSTLFMLRLF